jgi:hypothetical protein
MCKAEQAGIVHIVVVGGCYSKPLILNVRGCRVRQSRRLIRSKYNILGSAVIKISLVMILVFVLPISDHVGYRCDSIFLNIHFCIHVMC